MKYFLFLVLYPACGEAVYTMLQGPFNFEETCNTQMELVVAVKGPPEPGSIYKCEKRAYKVTK